MNLQLQFQMDDNRRRIDLALKKKGSATTQIVMGSVLLALALGTVGLLFLSIIGSSQSQLPDTENWVYGCCVSLAFLLGIPGIILLPLGLTRRHSAQQEIMAYENDNHEIKKQLIIEDDKRNNT